MLTPIEFKEITDLLEKDEAITLEQSKALLNTLYVLDANLVVVQNALELSVANAREIIPALAFKVMEMCGRNDNKSKKKVATLAGAITGKFEQAIHLYINGAFEEANNMVSEMQETTTNPEEETTNESN